MILSLETEDGIFRIDSAQSFDISIPLKFNGAQPNAYGVERAESKPCEAENLIGDTRRGGSCNFEQIKFIPHCNGTHTECVGHITHKRISVHDCLREAFLTAALISIEPKNANETAESYSIELSEGDKLITRKKLESANRKVQSIKTDALIIRTLPNAETKLAQVYLEDIPPFFSTEAMRFIREIGVKHLLVDVPSIDRIYDEGKLSNHRIFWNVAQGSFEANEKSLIHNTITELIYVPDEVEDGCYLLNLQIPPFSADAAPSRPILFKSQNHLA